MITVINFTIKDKISGIYCIYNKYTGKLYIGSSKNIMLRCQFHKSSLKANVHHSKLLQRAWNKYGVDAFEFMILEIVNSGDRKVLLNREQFWLNLNDSSNSKLGYNISGIAGSNLGYKFSSETKSKMKLGMTDERKAHLSAINTGKICGPRSEEIKAKIKATMIGQKYSEERKSKISKTLTGKKLSDSTKAKLKKVWADRKEAELARMAQGVI